MRIQFGGFADYPVGKQDSIGSLSWVDNESFFNEKSLNLRALVGIEWQKQIKRIQLYYGFDTGISYFEDLRVYSILYGGSPTNIRQYESLERSRINIPLYGFMGVKCFIHPRVSISIESALSLGFTWSTFKRINFDVQNNEETEFGESKRKEINLGTAYLRYLNVSFHF